MLGYIILAALLGYLFYHWATANHDYFEKRGIPYEKPFLFFGSMKEVLFRKKSMFDAIVETYNKYDAPFCGMFEARTPMYFIRDPELVKQITIKDFDHFMNHRNVFGDVDENNLFGHSLFQMHDAKWRDMRSTLSPAFTGSKMRQMFELIQQVAEESAKYLLKEAEAEQSKNGSMTKSNGYELDLKDYCTRFSSDIIASTAFGLKVNSFEEKDNEFYRMGKKVTTFSALQNLKFILYAYLKPVMKLLKWELFDAKSTQYFMRLVLDAMKYRKEHNITRPDMINMLMEARGMIKSDNPKIRDWSDVEIVGQCFLFFFAGFETSALLMCFAAHELMENPETQEKLLEEIMEVEQNLEGKPLTYERLQGMKYMDMVVSETLRKWPPAGVTDRMCNKDFKYEINGTTFDIKKGQALWIPIAGFHHDPKYYENPTKFDPERFNEENKPTINPCTYLPFGLGPRNCIGSRFALLEAKAILYYLVRDFSLKAAKKTTIPMELFPTFQMKPKNGFWLKLVPRNQA